MESETRITVFVANSKKPTSTIKLKPCPDSVNRVKNGVPAM